MLGDPLQSGDQQCFGLQINNTLQAREAHDCITVGSHSQGKRPLGKTETGPTFGHNTTLFLPSCVNSHGLEHEPHRHRHDDAGILHDMSQFPTIDR
jgi:hypothetical protein